MGSYRIVLALVLVGTPASMVTAQTPEEEEEEPAPGDGPSSEGGSPGDSASGDSETGDSEAGQTEPAEPEPAETEPGPQEAPEAGSPPEAGGAEQGEAEQGEAGDQARPDGQSEAQETETGGQASQTASGETAPEAEGEAFDLEAFYGGEDGATATEESASTGEGLGTDVTGAGTATETDEEAPSEEEQPQLTIVGFVDRDPFRSGGSVTTFDEADLEALEHSDPHQVLLSAPGVYVRGEDGYGLRPNIGIRGASSERSSRVTLMEDGVLFGPAPYAAPAAYYFPLINRMVGVEVFKGPSAVLFGPQTIGGAVNLRTRQIPRDLQIGVDVAGGLNFFGRAHGWGGVSNDWGGVLGEVLHTQSDGFKDLDGGGDTGFSRTDVMLRGALFTDLSEESFHRFELKLGFQREVSNETYLGLTDADFAANPQRRYISTANDRMEWWRTQVELRHRFELGDELQVVTALYRHDFQRSWFRLNRIGDGSSSLAGILADPTTPQNRLFYSILTGAEDSTEAERLFIIDNDRRFWSMGAQSAAVIDVETGPVAHRIELGLRVHGDQVDRTQAETPFDVVDGALQRAGDPISPPVTDNIDTAIAFAGYAVYALSWEGLTVMPGARVEVIATTREDEQTGATVDGTQVAVLPGLGLHYDIIDGFGVLAGVYRGFSPVAPGQPETVEPEYAVNWEAGVRYDGEDTETLLELIGFWNDYSNLLGTCTFSSGLPCELGSQLNGGEVDVFGLEAVAARTFELGDDFKLPLRVSYTLTASSFATVVDNTIFGAVEEGARVPYIPTHQASAQAGLTHEWFDINVQALYVGAMREPRESTSGPALETDPIFALNAVGGVKVFEGAEVYLRLENLTNTQPIVARRPFGARPYRPFTAQLGFKWTYGGDDE